MAKGSGGTRNAIGGTNGFIVNSNAFENRGGFVTDGKTLQGYIAEQKGFNRKPTLLSESEFASEASKEGNIVLYRGYRNDESENISNFKHSNEVYEGSGAYGEGHYFSPTPLRSFSATGRYVEAIVDTKKMKIGNYNELESRWRSDREAHQRKFTWNAYSQLKTDRQRNDFELSRKLYDDFGRWATLKGYDGVKVSNLFGDTEYVIYNRHKLMVKK